MTVLDVVDDEVDADVIIVVEGLVGNVVTNRIDVVEVDISIEKVDVVTVVGGRIDDAAVLVLDIEINVNSVMSGVTELVAIDELVDAVESSEDKVDDAAGIIGVIVAEIVVLPLSVVLPPSVVAVVSVSSVDTDDVG